MPDEMSDCSDDSFEIVSPETCEGLDKIPTSLVIFQDMFDVYPIDSDIVARVSLTGGYVKSTEDTVIIMPIAWTSIDQAFHAVQLNGNFVKLDAKILPKTSADTFYQLCYASKDKSIVGVSAPFSFREVYENELIEFQKEQSKEFWMFRSRFAILMNIYWNTLVESKRTINFEDIEVTSREIPDLIGHANSGFESSLVDLTKSVNSEALTESTLSDNDLVDIEKGVNGKEVDVCVEVSEKVVPFLKHCVPIMSVQQWQLVYETLISVEEAIQLFETQMKDFDVKNISNPEENESIQTMGFVCSNLDIRRDQMDILTKHIMRKKIVLDQLHSRVRSSDRDICLKKIEKINQLEVEVQMYKVRIEELERINASLIKVIRDGEMKKMDSFSEIKQLKAEMENVLLLIKDYIDCVEAAAFPLEEILILIPDGFIKVIAVNAIQNLCKCIQILKENALIKKKCASAAMNSIKIGQEVNLEDFQVEISVPPNDYPCAIKEVVSGVSFEMSGSKNCKESIPENVLKSSNLSPAVEQMESAYIVSLKTGMAKLQSEVGYYRKEHLNLSKKLRDTSSNLDYFMQLYQKQLQEKNEKDELYGAKLANLLSEKEKILNDFKKMKDDYEDRLRQGAKEYAKLYLKYQKYSKPSDHTYAASRLIDL